MKQLFQNLRTGKVELLEVPVPEPSSGHILIQNRCSLISIGTERMLSDFGRASLMGKARSQPDKVHQVIEKLRTDGIVSTLQSVFSKLDQPIPLGYSSTGTVLKVGAGVEGIAVGDRVASNGPHAEVVCVPRNLCSRVPDDVEDVSAAFAVVSSIALQGVRLLNPTLGESVAVIGAGLIGLITCQILRANGCRVIAFDLDPAKIELARSFGVYGVVLSSEVDAAQSAQQFSGGPGIDGVLITAATSSKEPVSFGAQILRKRGRMVLVGVAGLELNRAEFYQKELSFQVSCSYGPGRYDENYERRGMDYPIGFVRWTEERNIQAVLELLAQKQLDMAPLVSKTVRFGDLPATYSDDLADPGALGVIIRYAEKVSLSTNVVFQDTARRAIPAMTTPQIGIIGAGDFARAVLVPALQKAGANIRYIASQNGAHAAQIAKKFGVLRATSNYREILEDPAVNTVVIATRHDLHARLVIESLDAGKHVFVEKPLALTKLELDAVKAAHDRHPDLQIMVGFNRRFSPLTKRAADLLKDRVGPLAMVMVVNAGQLPDLHWTKNAAEGGGRIIGEACHFLDLLSFVAGSPISSVSAHVAGMLDHNACEDCSTITLNFADGSLGTVHYFSNGSKKFPKERLEVFSDGRVLQLDNFRILRGYGFRRFNKLALLRQDKGHTAEIVAFLSVFKGGTSPIGFDELYNVSEATLAAAEGECRLLGA